MLNSSIEEAFDNGEIVVVPVSLRTTPAEWNCVVLNPDLLESEVCQDPSTEVITGSISIYPSSLKRPDGFQLNFPEP